MGTKYRFGKKCLTEEHKRKIGLASSGRYPSDETRKKLSISLKNYYKEHDFSKAFVEHIGCKRPEEIKRKMSDSQKRFYKTPKGLENIRNKRLYRFSDEQKNKMSKSHKKLWQDVNYAKMMFISQSRKPTKPELILLNFLNDNFPNEWKYVGDGQVWIAGKNPDFINCNGKKLIIEFNGKYWHYNINKETERSKLFSNYGFKTLFLQEDDLINFSNLKEKIMRFNNWGENKCLVEKTR